MTETSLVKSIISFNLCVINTIVFPSSFKERSILNNSSTSCGVKTPVGSSKINTSAPRYNDFKISTLCRKPTDKSEMTESRSTFKLYVSHKFFRSIFAFSKFFPKTTSPSKPKTIFSRTVKFSTSIKC